MTVLVYVLLGCSKKARCHPDGVWHDRGRTQSKEGGKGTGCGFVFKSSCAIHISVLK